MCECGCSMSNPLYKLRAPVGWYVVELYGGCKDCSAAPGVIIRHVTNVSCFYGNLAEIPALPMRRFDEEMECAIVCGMEPDEFKKAAIPVLEGTEVDDCPNGRIDNVLADILADDLWPEVMRRTPTIAGKD